MIAGEGFKRGDLIMSQLFVIAALISLLYIGIDIKSQPIPVENDTVHKGR